MENALYNVKNNINDIVRATGAEGYTVYITDGPTFRDDAATIRPYKGNRDPSHKPIHYAAIGDYLRDYHPLVECRGIEADDALGIEQCTSDDETCIATIDKDLDMIPGWHYNFVRQEMYHVDEDDADYAFYIQLSTGDSTDNIVGIPGVGPAKARRILAGCNSAYDMYCAVRRAYNDDSALAENARLVWIWRKPNDLWTPPSPSSHEDDEASGQEERSEEESAITYGD